MKERYVLEALQKAVLSVTGSMDLIVKYVGRTLEAPSGERWLEIVYIPNNIENQYWDRSKTYRGVMRLIMHCPIDDEGVYANLDLAALIANGFTKGEKFADTGGNVLVSVTENPNVESVIEQSPEILIPITVRYSYFNA